MDLSNAVQSTWNPALTLATWANGRRPHVLLADDSVAARVMTAALLTRLGCQVDTAEHGEQALGLARNVRYDLILLDLDMPIMDGIATAREIRALANGAGRTPIMAFSAFLRQLGEESERRRLFDGEIIKPVTARELQRAVIDSRATGPLSEAKEGLAQPMAGDCPLIDLAARRGLKFASPPTCRVDDVVGELRAAMSRLESALTLGDRAQTKLAAQNIEQVGLRIGAPRLARRASDLKQAAGDGDFARLRAQANELLGCIAATIGQLRKLAAI